ncbi:MAG: redoxin domain-containing protein [Dehalococcoidia bacterium]|nr:redoxin domain-containing protein [Dehalococcoidia bacterium]
MAEQHREFLEAGAQVLAIVHDSPQAARAFLAQHPSPFPLLLDATHALFEQYGVESKLASLGQRPGLFVIDSEGVVRFTHLGRQQWEIPSNPVVLEEVRCLPCEATR